MITGCKEEKEKEKEPEITPPVEEKEDTEIIHTEVLLIDREKQYIELRSCPITTYDDTLEIVRLEDGKLSPATIDDLWVGMENVYVQYNEQKLIKILIDGKPSFVNIRVGIRHSIQDIADISTLFHDNIILYSNSTMRMQTFDGLETYQIPAETQIAFNVHTSITSQETYIDAWIGKTYIKTNKRLLIEGANEISVSSISRQLGAPSYYGRLEISIYEGKMLLVNEVPIENYLTKVVPSEMPSSWNSEALKAQAVAARTYAQRDIYNQKFPNYGYAVDDSEQSQVYNNIGTTEAASSAVSQTSGLCMFYEDEPIIAYYFSGSSGLTANGNEVWIEDHVIDEIPYLIGHNLTQDEEGNPIEFDSHSEESMLQFFKQIQINSPCGANTNHRWHVLMTKEQLKNAINANLKMMAATYPSSYPQLKDGEWVIADFPNDIGNIQNIEVDERGESGVVVSLKVTTDQLTFRMINQYNIRFTIRPRDAISDVMVYHGTNQYPIYSRVTKNDSILPSGFFALEWEEDTLHFYGGGSGHGVGMSQYGANEYANQGLDFKAILEKFYSNITFKNTNGRYSSLLEFEKYF